MTGPVPMPEQVRELAAAAALPPPRVVRRRLVDVRWAAVWALSSASVGMFMADALRGFGEPRALVEAVAVVYLVASIIAWRRIRAGDELRADVDVQLGAKP